MLGCRCFLGLQVGDLFFLLLDFGVPFGDRELCRFLCRLQLRPLLRERNILTALRLVDGFEWCGCFESEFESESKESSEGSPRDWRL